MDDLKDFLVLLSDGELKAKDCKLFRIISRVPSSDSLFETVTCVPVDVPVQLNNGVFLLNLISGHAFVGAKELDSQVSFLIKKDNLMMLKASRPNITLAWADSFRDLPYCFKSSKKFSTAMELIYTAFEKLDNDIEQLSNAQMQDSERQNMLTQSMNKQVENIKNVVSGLMQERIDSKVPGMLPYSQQGQRPIEMPNPL